MRMRLARMGSACLLLATALCGAQARPGSISAATSSAIDPQPEKSAASISQNGGQPEAPAPSSPGQAPSANPPQKPTERQIEKKEQSQRVMGVLPQFAVTSRQDAPPLSSAEKFHLFAKSAFDPVELGLVGVQAALSQGENEFPEYGQGTEGYAKRYGASLADEASSGLFSNYLYPVLLREDPRYFRLGEGSIKHRAVYAMKQEFVCHTDRGGRSFAWSNTLGAFSSGGLSNLYYPQADRGFGLTMSRSGIALLYGSLGGLLDEFWPDISRKIHRHHHDQGRTPDTAGSPKTP